MKLSVTERRLLGYNEQMESRKGLTSHMRRRMHGVLLIMLLGGCGETGTEMLAAHTPAEDVVQSIEVDTYNGRWWEKSALDRLRSDWTAFEKEHGVKVLMSGKGKEQALLQLRRYGDVTKLFTEEEKQRIYRSLYERAGEEFALHIDFLECCQPEKADSGTILRVDRSEKQILVSSKQNGTWYKLSEDAVIRDARTGNPAAFESFRTGQSVRVWNTGAILTSDPAHGTALYVEISSD